MHKPLAVAGAAFFVVGAFLFLSVFFSTALEMGQGPRVSDGHEKFSRDMDAQSERMGFIVARAPVGMGLMFVGGVLGFAAIALRARRAVDELAERAAAEIVCPYCKAMRGPDGVCPSCGAR